ncbi:hypothetical protein [Paraliobacillus sediminis]|nr:hypothetical protein [Paraliobacillus sediminis]
MGDTLVGIAQAEDPLGKVFFFTKLAEAVPTEREPICFRSWFVYWVTKLS